MSPELPFLIIVICGAAGAAILALAFRRLGFNPTTGALAGAGAGILGPLIFMVPLNFCTFETERKTIDVIFGIGLISVGMAITLASTGLIARWWRLRGQPTVGEGLVATQVGAYKGFLMPILLLMPTLAVLLLFLYYPFLDTFRLSTLLARLGTPRTRFVCVDNFTNLVSDPTYHQSILVTLGMGLAIVVIGLVLALLIAVMAYQPIKGAAIYRTLLIWPYAISPAVAGIIFVLMFNPAGGIINYFLQRTIGLQVGWLNDPGAAPWAVIIASVWKSMGFNILFYIAGLQNVPKDLQEAASIDGANAWQRYRHVVVPLLSPITFFLIITNLTYAFFETFATVDFLTRGGPLNATMTMMYRVYEVGVMNNDLGKGAAQSIVLFLMVIGLTVIQFRSTGRRVSYGG